MEFMTDIKYTKPVPFPNGTLKKLQTQSAAHLQPPLLRPPAGGSNADVAVYRECLKNHAASLGGHALDGCGEFMPSPAATPTDPTSLKCAACGCHRNFHRRLAELACSPHPAVATTTPPLPALPPVMSALSHHHEMEQHAPHDDDAMNDDDDEDDEDSDSDDETNYEGGDGSGHVRHHGPPAGSPYFSSAPHMLLALSSGGPNSSMPRPPTTPVVTPPVPAPAAQHHYHQNHHHQQQQQQQGGGGSSSRKRFRTKFSSEQKQRMQELSERLGWRLQKRDEAVVEQWCSEIGVGKGVFKVWMHNNKHNFLGGPRRGSGGGGGSPATVAAAANPGDHMPAPNTVTAPSAPVDGNVGGGGEGMMGQAMNGVNNNNAAATS